MSVLGELSSYSSSIFPMKEDIEIGETQLQRQIFNESEVKQNDGQSANSEEHSGILIGQCHDAEDNQMGLKHYEMNTIKKEAYNCSSSPTHDVIKTAAKRSFTIQDTVGNHKRTQHLVQSHRPSNTSHICSVCAKSFWTKGQLDVHMNHHTGSRPYACTICSKSFWSPYALHRHRLAHSKFKCTLCEKSYSSDCTLESHMNLHRGERPFRCKICSKSFASKHTLSFHNKIHFDGKKFECTVCNDKFLSSWLCRRHEKIHKNDRFKYQCDICKSYFKCADQYRSHLEDKCRGRTVGKPLQFQCTKCHEAFATIEIFDQHQNEIHPVLRKRHICSVCAKVYRYKKKLKLHMNTHTGNRPYACPMCPKSFTQPQGLNKHKLIHDEKYKRNAKASQDVQENEKSEKQVQGQNQIENIKIDEKPQKAVAFEKKYKCDECNKKFFCKRNLNFHMRLHAEISST